MSVFVGRTGELETLADVIGAARSGAVAAIVVGEPGSGKSRLLAEAQDRVPLRRLTVVGYEPGRHVPLAAAASLLRTLTEVPRRGALVEALLFRPEDAGMLEPLRLFEAAHRAFRTFEPALLVIDDLQWMDELSYALCHYLIRAAGESRQRVAVLAATRPGGRGAGLADGLPAERVTVIELPPLTRAEGIQLVLSIDAGLDRVRAAELWGLAGGSPFWLEALARTGAAVGGLGQLLTVGLRGAGSDAGALLGLLAVAGRPISVADAAALARWPADRVEAAAGELGDRGMVSEGVDAVGLAHDLTREAAVAQLAESSRRELHRRMAEWLERQAQGDLGRLREALEHRRLAGIDCLSAALRLARSPRRTLLGSAGLRLLAGIADETDPVDADGLALHEQVASLATELAEHEEAFDRWMLVAERAATPMDRASALLAASRAAYGLARVAEARGLLARSREVEAGDEVLRLEQDTHEAAILLWLEQRTAEGRGLAREAVAAATLLAARAGGAGGLGVRARRAYLDALGLDYEAAMQEDNREALRRAAEAREAGARGFDVETQLTASLGAGVALRQTGHIADALARFRRVWGEANRQVLPRLVIDAGFWLARSLELTGELAEAAEVIGKTGELAGRVGDVTRARYRVGKLACGIDLQRGRPRDALRRLERQTADESNEHLRVAFHQDLALWYSRLDGPAAAPGVHQQLAAGQACAEAAGCPRCTAELLLVSAEALARVDDHEEAGEALARWHGLARAADQLDEILRLRASGLAEPDPTRRATALDAALAAAAGSPYVLETLWTRLDLGLAHAAAGSGHAIGELERAAATASERGAGTVQQLAEQALRPLGVRTWRRRAGGTPLTGREQEIAELVAAGAPNREIATALFLSPKTVERHVSNLLKKLGARNRTELARRLRDRLPEDAGNPG